MDFKDKLNLLWKFLFLAVFTYGVISVTCCGNRPTCDGQKCKISSAKCGASCVKSCCAPDTQ